MQKPAAACLPSISDAKAKIIANTRTLHCTAQSSGTTRRSFNLNTDLNLHPVLTSRALLSGGHTPRQCASPGRTLSNTKIFIRTTESQSATPVQSGHACSYPVRGPGARHLPKSTHLNSQRWRHPMRPRACHVPLRRDTGQATS